MTTPESEMSDQDNDGYTVNGSAVDADDTAVRIMGNVAGGPSGDPNVGIILLFLMFVFLFALRDIERSRR